VLNLSDKLKFFFLFIRIFFILLIIGLIIPYMLNKFIEIFKLDIDYNEHKGNSVLVMSYKYFQNSFLYYLNRIIKLYFGV
jgi:hypothetical protein